MMPWREMDIMSQRYEFCLLASEPGANISALCIMFQISRETGYKWLHRYRTESVSGLSDRSRVPLHLPHKTVPAVEEAVISIFHEYPFWGPRKLRRLLEDRLEPDVLPSVSTIARILARNDLSKKRESKFSWPATGRFERASPNELWQMDLKGAIRLPNGQKVYPTGLLDDHSRYLLGLWMLPDQRDDSVLNCWIASARQHGLPDSTLTDHGAQFRMEDHASSAFRVYLWACGVSHTQGRVAHPQTQGKIERFWRTLNVEVLRDRSYSDLASWQTCFDDWRQLYNTVRPHQALDDEPPVKRYSNSDKPFQVPDRDACVGHPDSEYRRVNPKGYIRLASVSVSVGRGYANWRVECRYSGSGYWRIYFYGQLIKEVRVVKEIALKR